jgi:signal transduction histidine kinase
MTVTVSGLPSTMPRPPRRELTSGSSQVPTAEQRLTFLADAARALTGSFELARLMDVLAGLVVPRWAARCTIARPGQPSVTVPEGQDVVGGAVCEVALVGHAGVLGSLTLQAHPGRPYDVADEDMFSLLARYAGLALESGVEHASALAAALTREQVLGTMAHDVKSPLGVVLMSADQMKHLHTQGRCDPALVRKNADYMHRAAEKIGRLIDELVDYSRLQDGRFAIEVGPCPAARVVLSTADMFGAATRLRQITIETCIGPDLPGLQADQDRLVRALGGLTGLLLQYARGGGAIELGVRKHPGGGVLFYVQDRGAGVDVEELARLLAGQSAGPFNGNHLRLGLTRGVVAAHGGTLVSECGLDAGPRLGFTLPPS